MSDEKDIITNFDQLRIEQNSQEEQQNSDPKVHHPLGSVPLLSHQQNSESEILLDLDNQSSNQPKLKIESQELKASSNYSLQDKNNSDAHEDIALTEAAERREVLEANSTSTVYMLESQLSFLAEEINRDAVKVQSSDPSSKQSSLEGFTITSGNEIVRVGSADDDMGSMDKLKVDEKVDTSLGNLANVQLDKDDVAEKPINTEDPKAVSDSFLLSSIPNKAEIVQEPESKASPKITEFDQFQMHRDHSFDLLLPNIMSMEMFAKVPLNDSISDLITRHSPSALAARKLPTQKDVPMSLEGIEILVNSQSWRAVARLAQTLIARCERHEIELAFKLWIFRMIALQRLGWYSAAQEEFDNFGSFELSMYQYDSFPFLNKTGCMVPFTLRLLRAQLPAISRQNHVQSINEIYQILRQPKTSTSDQKCAYCLIVQNLLSMKEYTVAYCLVDQVISKLDSYEEAVFSLLFKILMQYGNVHEASKLLDKMEAINANSQLLLINKGLLSIALGDYQGSLFFWDSILAISSDHAAALNNNAICQIYQGSVVQAINHLEELVINSPNGLSNDFLRNLVSLYEIGLPRPYDAKLSLLSSVCKYIGDQVEAKSFKLE